MDPAVMILNFITIGKILSTVSIAIGLGLFLGGFFMLKRYGETRTFMSYHMTLGGPGMMILAGTMFLILPTTTATFLHAFWGGDWNPMRYSGTSNGWDAYIPVVIIFVRIIGLGSLMRGIMLLSRTGKQGSQPGTIGRALTHMLGGILLLHILGTVQLIKSILGWA